MLLENCGPPMGIDLLTEDWLLDGALLYLPDAVQVACHQPRYD